ncbi:MAG: DUF4157 domain-containing protein [Bryobacterales bacterium]|nr:DUF4157 domain-containing protein [Bryobacterales bacterium]
MPRNSQSQRTAARPSAAPPAPGKVAIQRKCAACDRSGSGSCPACEQERLGLQRQAEPGEARVTAMLAEDGAEYVAAGQIRKGEFLAQVRAAVCDVVDGVFAGTGRNAIDCSYVAKVFPVLENRSAASLESMLRRFGPDLGPSASATDYVPHILDRVRLTALEWLITGEVTGLPAGLPKATNRQPAAAAETMFDAAETEAEPVQFDAEKGGAASANPRGVQRALGAGMALDGGISGRMSAAFGRDFSGVRVHTDGHAGGLSRQLHARAFTVGDHVAFAPGQYRPGTLEGDALIAHELAHVLQQSRGLAGGGAEVALERDADRSAASVVAKLWTGEGSGSAPHLHAGLSLQRCCPDDAPKTKEDAGVDDADVEDAGVEDAATQDAAPVEKGPETKDGCLIFGDKSQMQVHKKAWAAKIAGMKLGDVVNWIVGTAAPPADAKKESETQMICMIHAMGIKDAESVIVGKKGEFGYRGFKSQKGIWSGKFSGKATSTFGAITQNARKQCPSLPASDKEWNMGTKSHKQCWTKTLSDNEKQREILRTSSAPGISRHHWGTDVDLFSTSPEHFEKKGATHFDRYQWLSTHAAEYGFIQSFTATSAKALAGTTDEKLGYLEERWHWSYWPIAQALLEFAKANETQVETALNAQWGTDAQYSYIKSNWKEFVFNVNQAP